ncbi:MAG: hypothetical protein HY985_06815 [Magnetospirillum sp.]|nr:hypothetical protein [Magnetospirillum sp.]
MSTPSIAGLLPPPNMQDRFATMFEAKGLSTDKASEIAAEVDAAAQTQMSAQSGPADPSSVRSAIDEKLEEAVAAGTLTSEEADLVGSALDEFESKMAANGPPGGAGGPPPGGPPPGGGGGAQKGGQSEEKSALEELLEMLKEKAESTSTSQTALNNAADYLKQALSGSLFTTQA